MGRLAGQECSVKRAWDQGPEAPTARGEILDSEDAAEQGCRVFDERGDVDRAVTVGIGLRAEGRGEDGKRGKDVGAAAGLVVQAARE